MLPMLGKDGIIHVCSLKNTKESICKESVPSARTNPDFGKLRNIVWCYDCSALLEDYERGIKSEKE